MKLIQEFPIIKDLKQASAHHWKEAAIELLVTLFFSLMPIWLGCVIVVTLTFPKYALVNFLVEFVTSSDLALICASVIGPLLYIIVGAGKGGSRKAAVPFPSGLAFILLIILICILSTVLYCLSYVSGTQSFFDVQGHPVMFTKNFVVALISLITFALSIFLILAATVIKNSLGNAATLMSNDTSDFVNKYKNSSSNPATGTNDFIREMLDSPKEEAVNTGEGE